MEETISQSYVSQSYKISHSNSNKDAGTCSDEASLHAQPVPGQNVISDLPQMRNRSNAPTGKSTFFRIKQFDYDERADSESGAREMEQLRPRDLDDPSSHSVDQDRRTRSQDPSKQLRSRFANMNEPSPLI